MNRDNGLEFKSINSILAPQLQKTILNFFFKREAVSKRLSRYLLLQIDGVDMLLSSLLIFFCHIFDSMAPVSLSLATV